MASITGTEGLRVTIRNAGRVYQEAFLKAAEVLYLGGYYMIETATGDATEPADAAGLEPLGLLLNFGEGAQDESGKIPEAVTGKASGAGVVRPRARFEVGEFTILDVPVGGAVAGDQTDVGKRVYLYTDNILTDLTITAGATDARAKGEITEFLATGIYVVRMYAADVIRSL